MNNLPITTSVPQTAAKPSQAAKPAQAANQFQAAQTAKPTQPVQAAKPAQADQAAKPTHAAQAAKPSSAAPAAKAAEDGATQGQAFGDVLARQVSEAATDEDAAQPKKISAKSADEIFANIKSKTDDDTALTPAGNANANLPAEMLATLMPQSASTPQNASATPDSALAQGAAIPQGMPIATAAEASALSKKTGLPADTASTNAGMEQPGVGQNLATAGKAAPAHLAPQADAKKDAAFSNMMETITAATSAKFSEHDEKAAALAAAPQSNAAALASLQAATTALNPANALPAQVTINTPVTHDKWGDEFNQKITWLTNQKEQTAELHLNPPQLGPMDVVIKVSGDQATALFTSPHAAVREAVEQALPRLREMLADSGIMLGNATVSDQAPRNRQDDHENKSSNSRSSIGGIADAATPGNLNVRVSPISRHNGIVDTFA